MCAPPDGPLLRTASGEPDAPPTQAAEAPAEKVAEVNEHHESVCSLRHIINRFLLPMTVGGLNGFPWSGVGLHFREQEWALWRLGLCSFLGFAVRMMVGTSMLKWGFWPCLPICVVHLLCLIPVIMNPNWEMAVMLQMIALLGFDSQLANDFLVFYNFRSSQALALRATSQKLASLSGATLPAPPLEEPRA